MRRIRKCGVWVGLCGSTMFLPSCSTALLQSVRDAAFTGAASFIEQATFDVLDAFLGTEGTTVPDETGT